MKLIQYLLLIFCSISLIEGFRLYSIPTYRHHFLKNVKQTTSKLSMTTYVPFYPNDDPSQYQWMDIYNTLGRQYRTLFITKFIDDEMANQLISCLLWLHSQHPTNRITILLNCPGGDTQSSMALYDTIKQLAVKCEIQTINMGLTCGIGTLIAASGTRGLRYCYPNGRFLMSTITNENGIVGNADEIILNAKEIKKKNEILMSEYSRVTTQPLEKIQKDLKRDFYLTAMESILYGVCDKVFVNDMNTSKIKVSREQMEEFIQYGHFVECDPVHIKEQKVTPKHSGGKEWEEMMKKLNLMRKRTEKDSSEDDDEDDESDDPYDLLPDE